MMRSILAVLLIVLLLNGCAGAAGAARLGMAARAGVGLRGGMALQGSRMAAARAGLLSRGLAGLTRSGAGRAMLRVDRWGRVFYGADHLAVLGRNGAILHAGSRQLLGEVAGGRLLEVAASGERVAIGRVYSLVRRGSLFRSSPGHAATGMTLRRDLLAEIVQMQDQWYHVRLLSSGTTGWVWAPVAGMALLALDEDEDERDPAIGDDVRVLLDTGETLRGKLTAREERLTALELPDGRVAACDPTRVERVERAEREIEWSHDVQSVRLVDGRILLANDRGLPRNGVVTVELLGGETAFLDPALIHETEPDTASSLTPTS